ncbi:MAG: hypothetical protein N4A40_09840 [Tissierellales bacterium]|jgi:hypothetical protein|nr:hypothetical protein [Tissierellales bacterium]
MAITSGTIKKKLEALGVYDLSMSIAINELVEVDKEIDRYNAIIEEEGESLKEITREGNVKIVNHSLIASREKSRNLKQKLLNDLLLTPQSLKKNGIELTKSDEDMFEDALIKRADDE